MVQNYQTKILSLGAALNNHRDHSTATVSTYSRFSLPFAVQPTVLKHNIGYQYSGALIM